MDTKIFKSYDIRGIYPNELNEDIAYKIGRAMVVLINAKKVVLGRDARLSSPSIFEAVSRGIMKQGADVVDIGLCTTPMLSFSVANFEEHDAGIMITASHNPKEYSGMKLYRSDGSSIGGGSGMEEIRDIVLRNNFSDSSLGKMSKMDVLELYLQKIYSLVDISKISPLKVAIDVGNGMTGIPLLRVLEKIPCEIIPLYFEPDCAFPNHQANPLEEKNLEDAKKAILENFCDLGIALDGDGDRCVFIDETGKTLRGDITTIILSKKILKEHPGRKVVYDLISSWILPEEVKKNNGKPIISKVGHSHIKAIMRKENAILGGEMSGHLYFGDFFNLESSILAILLFLEIVSMEGKRVSEIAEPFFKYFHTGEINFKVDDKEAKIQQVEEKFSKGAKNISHLDGIKIDFEDWWLNVRPSNTESLLRLNLEAKTKELMEQKKEELTEILLN